MPIRTLRQTAFVLSGTLLRIPLWTGIWILGRLRLIKVIFLVYPTDEAETRAFCPDIRFVRAFFSARPTPAGLITQGFRPLGIYLVVPNTIAQLAKKKNKQLSHEIVRRLRWAQQFTGAESVGLAGQLSSIFENRHGILIEKPLYGSLPGSLFSLSETIFQAMKTHRLPIETTTLGILGGGDIGEALSHHMTERAFRVIQAHLRFTRTGKLQIQDEQEIAPRLSEIDLLVNLTPTGKHFLQTNCDKHLSEKCLIIDFSRPGIPSSVPHRIYMGNRVQHEGIRFRASLPGWPASELPACSLAAMLAAMTDEKWETIDGFNSIARTNDFRVILD